MVCRILNFGDFKFLKIVLHIEIINKMVEKKSGKSACTVLWRQLSDKSSHNISAGLNPEELKPLE